MVWVLCCFGCFIILVDWLRGVAYGCLGVFLWVLVRFPVLGVIRLCLVGVVIVAWLFVVVIGLLVLLF